MFKLNRITWIFLFIFGIFIVTDCGMGQSKKESATEGVDVEANALLQEQNELYEKACEDLSSINQKVIELNSKIHSMESKLTDEQNTAIDEIEQQRASINTRMRGLKSVSQADWENYKTTLVKDMDDMKIKIDELLNSIN